MAAFADCPVRDQEIRQTPMTAAHPTPPPPASLLALNHVTVMRGERAALHDITLQIGSGVHVCILGPNGCGKSTLIKTITRECHRLASPTPTTRKQRRNTSPPPSLLRPAPPSPPPPSPPAPTGRDVVPSGF